MSELDSASLTETSVGTDSRWKKQVGQTRLGSLGDASFAAAVDGTRFKGGTTTVFSRGEIIDGGDGRLVTSVLVDFADPSAATLLINHPDLGQTTELRDVAVPQYGDETKAIYFETPDGYVGYVIQFRVATVVVYIGDVGVGESPVISDVERFAETICAKLETTAPSG